MATGFQLHSMIKALRSAGFTLTEIARETGVSRRLLTRLHDCDFGEEVPAGDADAILRLFSVDGRPQAATRLMPRFAPGCTPRWGR